MAITQSQFISWLSSNTAQRVVLVEAGVMTGGVEAVRYLSNAGYVTSPTDTPANTAYLPYVAGMGQFTEQLSLDGSPSISFGDLELFNASGELDAWLFDVWSNRTVKVYLGDSTWTRGDFQLIFAGVIDSIGSAQRNRLNLKVRDKLQLLNNPISEAVLGGTTSNAQRLIPLTFGEVHNVEPLLITPSSLTYQVHNSAIESVIEVRDNGVPVTVTQSLASGTFQLTASPVGQITVSVQGDKPSGAYSNTVGALVQRIATGYGPAATRLTAADFDTTAMTAFNTACPQPVGIYCSDRVNVLEACQQLAASVGAQIITTPTGLIRLVQLGIPVSASDTLTTTDMLENTLQIGQVCPVKAAVQLGYCKNWTVQTGLASGLSAASTEMFTTEYLTINQSDSTVAANYKLDAKPTEEDTLLLVTSDATAEAARRLALWKIQRMTLKVTCFANKLLAQLGAGITVTHSRYGLSAGKTGQIIGITRDWMAGRVTLEVLV